MIIENNVKKAIDRAANLYGSFQARHFAQLTEINLAVDGVKSPIEQIFYASFMALGSALTGDIKTWQPSKNDEFSVFLNSQVQIGKFRVDFIVTFVTMEGEFNQVVIELDGHDFHDKNKEQRAYEKSRDRYLTAQGFPILHYTGSEICKDPFKAVVEALAIVKAVPDGFADSYDPKNPLGGY
jgi:very-short-patch-repair endonuclease